MAQGSFQSKSYSVSGSYDGELVIEWNSQAVSGTPGQTKVNWTLMATGREKYSSGSLWTTAKVNINGVTVWSIKDSRLSYKNNTITSGSFIVNHNSSGIGTFLIEIKMSKKYNPFSEQTYSTEAVLDKNYPYTNSYWENGTTVSIEKAYIIPNEKNNVKVVWSKPAKAGTGISIIKYQVGYKIGEGNWVFKDTDNASETSYTFSNVGSDSDRGKSISVRVQAISSNINYSSAVLESATKSYINIKPTKPSISNYDGKSTKNIVPSGTASISIKYTLTKKSSGQTVVAQLSNNNFSSKIDSTSGVCSVNLPNTQTTIKVRSYDGLEYSEEQSITIVKNSSQINDLAEFSLKNYIFQVKVPSELSTAAQAFGQGYSGNFTFVYKENDTLKSKNLVFSQSYTIDIRSLIGIVKRNTNYVFSISATLTDGVNTINTANKNWGTVENGDIKNGISFLSPNLSIASDKTELNQYFNHYIVPILTFNGSAGQQEKDRWYIDEIININSDEGEIVNQVAVYGSSAKNSWEKFTMETNSLKKIKKFNKSFGIGNTNNTYNPYTDILSLSCAFDGDWLQYGLFSYPKIKFYFESSVKSNEVDLDESSSNDTLVYSLSSKDSFLIAKNFVSSTQKVVKKNLKYEYQNAYGETVTCSVEKPIQLDFRTLAKNVTTDNCWIKLNNEDLNNWDSVVQQMRVTTSLLVASTTTPIIRIQLGSYTNGWKNIGIRFSGKSTGQVENIGNTEVDVYDFSSLEIVIEKIEIDENGYFRAVVETDAEEYMIQVLDIPKPFKKLVEPFAQFKSLQYKNEGQVFASYEVLNLGCSNNNLKKLDITGVVRDKMLYSQPIEINFNSGNVTLTFDFEEVVWDYIYIAPVLTTYIEATLQKNNTTTSFTTSLSTKINNLDYLVCYNISPTVSYRQNHIGINTNQIDENDFKQAVAVISQYNTRNLLQFLGANDNNTITASIDLSKMSLNNFIIDGGEWN